MRRREALALPLAAMACGDDMRIGIGIGIPAATAGGGVSELVELSGAIAADAYGDTHVNTAMLRCCNPVTDLATGIQYGAFHTQTTPNTTLFKRTFSGGAWGAFTVDESADLTTANDAHNFFSLAVDGSSRLHLSGDMHGVPMQYARFASGDINWTAWETPPIDAGSTLETLVTYPVFMSLADGDLLMFFRDGGSGDGTLVMYRWDNAGAAWNTVHATLVNGEGVESFYPWQIRYDAVRGKLHIGGCWRRTTDLFTNHDLIYFYLLESEDFANAYKASGAAQTLPVTRANADKAKTIAEDTGLLNTGGTGWDANGEPILSYFRDPGDGFSQLYVSHRSGGAWVEKRVPGDARANPQPFTLTTVAGDWPLSVFSSPSLLVDGGRTIIVGTYTSLGLGVWAWVCEEPTLTNWQPHLIDATDVQEWACVADLPQWDTNGELYTLHQKAVRPAAAPIGAQTLRVLRWRPQSAPYTYEAPAALWDPDTYAGCIGYVAPRVGAATVHGVPGANQDRCNDLQDARDASALFVQATNSDAPGWDHDFFDHGGLGVGEHRPGVRFTAANLDVMLATDAATLTALTGVNVPLALFLVIQPVSVLVNQRFGSFGTTSDTTRYVDWGTDASGHVSFGRRVAGGAETRYIGTDVLVAGTKYILSYIFDGTNGWVRVDSVQQGAAINMAFAGTLTPTDPAPLLSLCEGSAGDPGIAHVGVSAAGAWLATKRGDTGGTNNQTGGTADTNPHVFEWFHTGTAVSLLVDGTTIINAAAQDVTTLSTNQLIILGSTSTPGTPSEFYADCDVGEVCMYTGARSATERAGIRQYLKNAYGL